MEPVSQKRTGPSHQGQAQGWSEAERYLGVLGDDSPGSAGGRMPQAHGRERASSTKPGDARVGLIHFRTFTGCPHPPPSARGSRLRAFGCPHPPPSARASRLRAVGCPHPPPSAFPVSALELPWRQHQRGRRGCVFRSRQIVLLEPPGIDAPLPAGLLLWEAGISRPPGDGERSPPRRWPGVTADNMGLRNRRRQLRKSSPGIALCS
jgi:hypothetical protein